MSEPRYNGTETTGFASPAQDHGAAPIDLAEILELRSPGRYCVRVVGNGLVRSGILDGDYLVVDADSRPAAGSLAIAFLDGRALLGELGVDHEGWLLLCGNTRYRICGDIEIWAIARALVRASLVPTEAPVCNGPKEHADPVAP